MARASRAFLVALIFSGLPQASAVASRRSEVSLEALWDDHLSRDAREMTVAAAGTLLRKEEPEAIRSFAGTVANRFIARIGLEPADGAAFAGSAALVERLDELHRRCPGAVGKGWNLYDAAKDSLGGHHWVLQGPGVAGSAQVLLHVSSEVLSKGKGHAPLGFSSRKHCRQSGASLVEDPELDDIVPMQLSNPTIQDSFKFLKSTVTAETAKKCSDHQVASGVEPLSAVDEVTGGLNVMLKVKLLPKRSRNRATYHTFTVLWKLCRNCAGGMRATLELPWAKRGGSEVQMAWCELMSSSTEHTLAQLAEDHGENAPSIWMRKLGLLNAYRDFRPNPNTMLERNAGTRKAANCVPKAPDVHDPRIKYPNCFAKELVEDQGPCGSCWAFAAMQSLAARACMKEQWTQHETKSFSKQHIISCNSDLIGCQGGHFAAAYEEARKGLTESKDYAYEPGLSQEFPWHAAGKRCEWGLHAKPWTLTSHYALQGQSIESIKMDILCKGPVNAGIAIKSNFFSFWDREKKRVFEKADEARGTDVGGHAVTLVGWGSRERHNSQGTIEYWDTQNSWGSSWGNDGYCQIELGRDVMQVESMTVHAGDLEPTTGSWMYGDWSTCDDANGRKSRSIKCRNNANTQDEVREMCPNGNLQSWPNPFSFPDATSMEHQEMEAFKSCTDQATSCDSTFCKGHGSSFMLDGGCQCRCGEYYDGDTCDTCRIGSSGYPNCRELCAENDCRRHGIATGNKWKNEFGAAMDSCTCECDPGFEGDICDRCSSSSRTYPHCEVSIESHNQGPTTTTTTTTMTVLTTCHANRGKIELLPPTGINWLVINCDVRKHDCFPDLERCNKTVYQRYCSVQNTDEFPMGQCMNKENGNYHAIIANTTRNGTNTTEMPDEMDKGPRNMSHLTFR